MIVQRCSHTNVCWHLGEPYSSFFGFCALCHCWHSTLHFSLRVRMATACDAMHYISIYLSCTSASACQFAWFGICTAGLWNLASRLPVNAIFKLLSVCCNSCIVEFISISLHVAILVAIINRYRMGDVYSAVHVLPRATCDCCCCCCCYLLASCTWSKRSLRYRGVHGIQHSRC